MEESTTSSSVCIGNLNLPENVLKILDASCAKSTWSRYSSYINKYKQFCSEAGFHPSQVNVKSVLCFLSKLYSDGLSYSSINSARSALSVTYGKVDNVSVGEHPIVKRF